MVQFHNFEARINWEREGQTNSFKVFNSSSVHTLLDDVGMDIMKVMRVCVPIIISQSKVTVTTVTLSSSSFVIHLGLA